MHRYFTNEKNREIITLRGNTFHHIKNVIKLNIGDKIECVYEGRLFLTSIYEFHNDFLNVKISEEVHIENKKHKIIAIVGIIREQKFDFLLQKLTEIGVDEIWPCQFIRSVVKINENNENKKLKRWGEIIKSAAEQSKQIKIPHLKKIIRNIKEIETIKADIKIIAWEEEKNFSLKSLTKKINKVAFIVGPEGGIDKTEVDELTKFGYIPISLGDNILRAETAAIYLLSILNYLLS
ncbi:RsmE family RNA methyltransferase [Spiroplasma endosymbiont of Aspidapion aeneum]|uniref:RsmE family RNA methyltransferase n=1 Tax=Spiroplasma endosymbiont of Aspidapion aeneum TaxID=3066276 RepID=UPI00313EF8D8